MGWLGAALQTAVPMLGARQAGQNQGVLLQRQLQQEDEDRKARRDREAMQAALLTAQTGYYNRRDDDQEWKPKTEEEATRFYGATHPAPERNIDPNSPGGIAAALERHRGERSWDASHPIPSGAAGEPEFDARDPKNHMKILNAYMQKSGQGHVDPDTQEWVPPAPPEQRIKDAEVAYQEMARLTGPFADVEGGSSSSHGAFAGTEGGSSRSGVPAPAAPPAPPTPGPVVAGKRVITQDQMDFLQAHNRWDPSLYEVR